MNVLRIMSRVAVSVSLASGLFCGAAFADAAETSRLVGNLEVGKKQTVVVFGTSLTAVGAWVDELGAVLDQLYPGQVMLINGAQGGANSDWGREALEEKVLRHNPDTVLIEFSVNDAMARRKTSVEHARGNLENMIERILAQNPECEIILQVMNPAVGHTGRDRPMLSAYNQMYRDVAKERGFMLIDHYPFWEKLLNSDPGLFIQYVPDTIHPVRAGALHVITPTLIRSLGLEPGQPELNERAPCWNYIFGMMDKEVERNRQVTGEEYDHFWRKHLGQSDANKDGVLQPDEYLPAGLFNHFDADDNGTITQAEYLTVYAPHFERFDENADGVLDDTEIWTLK